MSKYCPLSLAQHFEAPDNYRSCFGWLCGYSADAAFLDDAAERFTRQTRRSRESDGRIALAVMLDPGNTQISLIDAPSVAHLPIKNPNDKPFLLLHAKIAIIGFQSNELGWQLRLIVSTGNWTRQTLEDSIDLAWRIDLSSEDLKNPDAAANLACADIKAAWGLLSWLRNYFDTKILDALPQGREDTETGNAKRLFESWIEEVEKNSANNGQTKARFFDNQKKSLFDQLPAMIKATGFEGSRNYLAMGSGFYEATSNNDAVPSMLSEIYNSLRSQQLLTVKPEMDIFVNPMACQAVAISLDALKRAGFTVRPAGQPAYFGLRSQRSLHAKFIFSAKSHDNSNLCKRAWLYLGSGNLTGPGFRNKMSAKGGNLEAGIVFAPEDLYWEHHRDINPAQVITNVLPVQWETDASSLPNQLLEGTDMSDRDIQFIAAPVAWLFLGGETGSCWLKAPDGATTSFEVLNETGEPCGKDSEGRFLWKGNYPRQVRLLWKTDGQTHYSTVPVLDEFGRLAATELSQIDIDEAWWQLANFPMPPDDEDLPPIDGPNEPSNAIHKPAITCTEKAYPVRQMMQFIENVAAKQTLVSQVDWPAWCTRLEQCLMQASGNLILEAFVKLNINPLSPLRQPPFRPTFAESTETQEGQRYEAVLDRIETNWHVASLSNIGRVDDETRI